MMNTPGHERNVQAEQMPNLRNLGLSKSSQRPIREPSGSGSGSRTGPYTFEDSDAGVDRTTLKWHDLGAHAGTVQLLDGEEVILNQSPSKYPKVLVEHDFALKMRDGRKYNGIVSLNLVTPRNRGIPDGMLSCLDKFEAPDPADRIQGLRHRQCYACSRAATGHGRDSSKETWNQQAKDELMYFFDNFPKGEDNGWQKTLKVEENIALGTVAKVEIGIWAMGVEYEAGEGLRFVVSGRSKAVSSFCSNDAVNKNGAYKIDYAVNIRAL
ncbi:hypothetical protein PoMZ_05693 [Pyricularia oryzae]|uniref:Uncharacterized protein n=1 Tax=Pyricularia oryzae TaxID=318829 RepID=A0A4P7NPB2_PYROR|nr:hypothetical protein PoMZ_05693 [Pyricularia oryzae]